MQANRAGSWLISGLLVAGVSAMAWQYGGYIGDDRNTLEPVARHSLALALQQLLRPLEYGIVQAANLVNLQLWLVASLAMAVAAAALQVKTVEFVIGKAFPRAVWIAAVAGSPLWFQLISQVDTVSQCLCNLVFAGAVYVLLAGVLPAASPNVSLRAAAVNLLCCVLLFTKELALAAAVVIPCVAAVIVWRRRAVDRIYVLSAILLAASLALWAYLKLSFGSLLPGAEGHYSISLSVSKTFTDIAALAGFPLTPLPTSLLSFEAARVIWSGAALVMIVVFVTAVGRHALRAPADSRMRLGLLGVVLIGGSLPIIAVHSSELYATMIGGYLVALLIGTGTTNSLVRTGYAAALLACSYINAGVYHRAELLPAWTGERVEYSLYEGKDGRFSRGVVKPPICTISGTYSVSWVDDRVQCNR